MTGTIKPPAHSGSNVAARLPDDIWASNLGEYTDQPAQQPQASVSEFRFGRMLAVADDPNLGPQAVFLNV